MVFRRSGTRRYTFQAKTETGWRQLPAGTTSRTLAQKIAAMWDRLADAREWDLLNRVLAGEMTAGQLWDLWVSSHENVGEMRRRVSDTDLEPLVAEWAKVYGRQRPKNLAKNLQRVRWLLPTAVPLPRSRVTTAWLTERLYAYPGKANTLRGVHSAWSVLFDYLTRVHGLFPANPMLLVGKPAPARQPVRFYEQDAVSRIVDWQPTRERRAFFAIAYGTGIESGVTLNLTRADLNPADREIRAAGTKSHTRDRMARVSAWAWPIIWGYAKSLLPTARLFPTDWRDDMVSHWHQETVAGLKLGEKLRLHAARHFWAATHLRAGVPVAVVQKQLGHSTPVITLAVYGPFIPTGDDRARWEAQMTSDQARRRDAK